MFYYKVVASDWPTEFEFKSKIPLAEGQCFRILKHIGWRTYSTRFKVLQVSETPRFDGPHVELLEVDLAVDTF